MWTNFNSRTVELRLLERRENLSLHFSSFISSVQFFSPTLFCFCFFFSLLISSLSFFLFSFSFWSYTKEFFFFSLSFSPYFIFLYFLYLFHLFYSHPLNTSKVRETSPHFSPLLQVFFTFFSYFLDFSFPFFSSI